MTTHTMNDLSKLLELKTRQMVCPTHGKQQERSIGGMWFGCPVCTEIKAKDEAAQAAVAKQKKFIDDIHIPRLFKDAGFKNYRVTDKKQERVFDRVQQYAVEILDCKTAKAVNLVLAGTTGVGKTHLACAILRNAGDKGVRALYVSSANLIAEIRASWDYKTRTQFESEIIERYGNAPVLMIDDLGVNDMIKADIWSDLFDKRYRQNLPTIITTNLGEAALAEMIGDRAADRLLPKTLWANCIWGSHRKTVAKMEYV